MKVIFNQAPILCFYAEKKTKKLFKMLQYNFYMYILYEKIPNK